MHSFFCAAEAEEGIERIHRDSSQTYGAARIHAELRVFGYLRCARKRVARLMRKAGFMAGDVSSGARGRGVVRRALRAARAGGRGRRGVPGVARGALAADRRAGIARACNGKAAS